MIVIDDRSTDGSGRVARECGAVVLRSPGGSVAELRNRGARAALGTILAFADSDHEIAPHWIDAAVSELSTPQTATGPAPGAWRGNGNLAVRRAAFQAIGGFNAEMSTGEDVDLFERITAGRRPIAEPAPRATTLRNLCNAAIPVYQLAALGACAIALFMNWWWVAAFALLKALTPAALRAALILRSKFRPTIAGAAKAFVDAVVFDAAQASALFARATHQTRRSA